MAPPAHDQNVGCVDDPTTTTPRATSGSDDKIADQDSDRMSGALSHNPCHKVLPDVIRDGDIANDVVKERSRVYPLPVLLTDGAEAEIFDPGASSIEELTDRSAFRNDLQTSSRNIDTLLEGRAQVWSSYRDQVPNGAWPTMPVDLTTMQRAADHQATHRVADQRDLFDRNRPVADSRLQQDRQFTPVV